MPAHHVSRRLIVYRPLAVGLVSTLAATACMNTPPVLARLIEARHTAATLRSSFSKANEASSRAVLAPSDDQSQAAATEARTATAATAAAAQDLERLLQSLGYESELSMLAQFKVRFDEYRKLDEETLSLAVENTNVKAQHLAFGSGREAAASFAASLQQAAAQAPSADLDAAVALARADVLEIEVLQARHIAEADDATMTQIEGQQAALAKDARDQVARLRARIGSTAGAQLDAAATALTRFLDVNGEIVSLSRRNTNVRSLGLTLGHKRLLAGECEDALRTIDESLAGHGSQATR
jgi:hypothetical protein